MIWLLCLDWHSSHCFACNLTSGALFLQYEHSCCTVWAVVHFCVTENIIKSYAKKCTVHFLVLKCCYFWQLVSQMKQKKYNFQYIKLSLKTFIDITVQRACALCLVFATKFEPFFCFTRLHLNVQAWLWKLEIWVKVLCWTVMVVLVEREHGESIMSACPLKDTQPGACVDGVCGDGR